ncbi:MAG: hypothetical protein R3357_14350 [Burkholderiales bacterium]|nr:hypothetical protein [Burkholderiales bacterium]
MRAALRPADRLQASLGVLRRLCLRHDSIDALLNDATQVALELLGAAYCSVIWLAEDKSTLRVRARGQRTQGVPCADDDAQAIAFVARRGEAPATGSELSAALRMGGQSVGYLYARGEARRARRAAELDRTLFEALAEHLGFAIETQTLRQLLASRYAAIALSRDGRGEGTEPGALDMNFLAAVTEPEKVARIIARSFYKDLRKAGFETKQILVVATELIDSLNVALRRTKAKTTQAETVEAREPAR